MKHWEGLYPSAIHKVKYENFVKEPEDIGNDLFDFCGLDWDNKFLEFYKNKSAVHTASNIQVREPIYVSSIDNWKNYEAFIDSNLLNLEYEQ
jgi:hypothetical protein